MNNKNSMSESNCLILVSKRAYLLTSALKYMPSKSRHNSKHSVLWVKKI